MKPYNITVGFIANYCLFHDLTINRSVVSNYTISRQTSLDMIGKRAWYTYYSDLSALVAIDMINNSTEILPDIHINVKRFTDCGQWKPNVDITFKGNTIGFASSTLIQDIVDNNPDIIGVIGFQVSSTARGTGQVLSLLNIPYCTGCSTSPRLSNKHLFPYVWRPLPGLGLGNHIYQVLRKWNVKRVAIVYQRDDDLGTQYAMDMLRAFAENDVYVAVNLALKTTVNGDVLGYSRQMLLNSDARYVIISGQNLFTSQIYQGLTGMGLAGPQFVWMSFAQPNKYSIPKIAPGFIYIQPPLPISNSSLFAEFRNAVLEKANVSPPYFTINDATFKTYASQFFDCGMMLLRGFDKLLKENPTLTPPMLLNRQLQNQMNSTLFRNVSYEGLMGNPENYLDANGDLTG
ncbi:UNVERIFIED_CONTAM: hypothetical protein HDU68_002413 [Siphonaria sp. JEL0065]|nr:hypothetical protein HDU68_002413 [Siphonaria sp. JEL0065]